MLLYPGVWRFGMVTMETEVEELLTLVINCGKDIDEAVNQLQSMSEVVKNGVKQAQEELRKEADNQIWQEGILRWNFYRALSIQADFDLPFRHVPIVGSFYNWLSPVPEEAKAKGRYLNLQEGKLETTDKMYKHHMQVKMLTNSVKFGWRFISSDQLTILWVNALQLRWLDINSVKWRCRS